MPFITRRFIFYLVAFFVAASFNFLLPRLMPGDPVTVMFSSSGTPLPVEAMDALKETFGFVSGPLHEQYFAYLKSVFTWDLGMSVQYYPLSVNQVLSRATIWTLFLVGISTIISMSLGSLAGIYAAWYRGSKFDIFFSPFSMVIQSIPAVILSLIFLYIFGVKLQILPTGYAYNVDLDPEFSIAFIMSVIYHSILPITTLVLMQIGGYLITIRNNMINILGSDYIVMARAKGLNESRVMLQYGARNALLPSITTFAMTIGSVLGGALITEYVFNYPGLGNSLYLAIINRDYPVIQGQLLIMTLAMLTMNFLADLAYVYLDPRLRKG